MGGLGLLKKNRAFSVFVEAQFLRKFYKLSSIGQLILIYREELSCNLNAIKGLR